jgi:hypothetical protein
MSIRKPAEESARRRAVCPFVLKVTTAWRVAKDRPMERHRGMIHFVAAPLVMLKRTRSGRCRSADRREEFWSKHTSLNSWAKSCSYAMSPWLPKTGILRGPLNGIPRLSNVINFARADDRVAGPRQS